MEICDVHLRLKFKSDYSKQYDSPHNWDWSTMLDLAKDEVEVVQVESKHVDDGEPSTLES